MFYNSHPRVDIHRAIYKLLMIIIWIGVHYHKSDEDFLGKQSVAKVPLTKNNLKIIVRRFVNNSTNI